MTCRRALPAIIAVLLSLCLARGGHTQGGQRFDSQQVPGFPVTGRMICADTQRAARFAQVTLLPTSQEGGRRLSARTDLDGNFLIPNAPAGDYYVTGQLPGYVNQTGLVQSTLNNDPGNSSALAGVPLIHVSAGGASTLLSLQRGATVAGAVTWDDGTPAAGVSVSAQPASSGNTVGAAQLAQGVRGFGAGAFYAGGFSNVQTDDRGRFRLSGLAPGSYFIRANVQAPAPQRPGDSSFSRVLNLAVYAPHTLRRSEAAPIPLTSGEERADLSLVIGLAGLHSVAGSVSSSSAPVRSGSASLTDQTDSSLNRNVVIGSDGSFLIPYVPPGTYTLRINASSQANSFNRDNNASATSPRFQPLQESITVTDTDLTGLAVTVTQATATQ